MFVVMNRFQVTNGGGPEFESFWEQRERHLPEFEGFVSFALLRSWLAGDGTTEYISHTIWQTRQDFEVWCRSDAFKLSHSTHRDIPILKGPPLVEVYDALLVENNPKLEAVSLAKALQAQQL